KPDKEVDGPYNINIKKQPKALHILLDTIDADQTYIDSITSLWNNPKSYNEQKAINEIAPEPTFNNEQKLNKMTKFINKATVGRIINNYLDIPKYLIFASFVVEYVESKLIKKSNPFNVYRVFKKKSDDPEKRKTFYGKFKKEVIKAMTALKTVSQFVEVTSFKLNIKSEFSKLQLALKERQILHTSIEILIWYKYFGPIIAAGNSLGELSLWSTLKKKPFEEICNLVEENTELQNALKKANDNYGWNIAYAIKKYVANLNLDVDLTPGHYLSNNPICYDPPPQSNVPNFKDYLGPNKTLTNFKYIILSPTLQNNSIAFPSIALDISKTSKKNKGMEDKRPVSLDLSLSNNKVNKVFTSLPSPSQSNESLNSNNETASNEDTNMSDVSNLFTSSLAEAREREEREQFLASGRKHMENHANSVLNQYMIYESNWGVVLDQVYEIIESDGKKAKDLIENIRKSLFTKNKDEFNKDFIALKETTRLCSEKLNEFVNEWAEKLDSKLFQETLIRTTIQAYDSETLKSSVNFIQIVNRVKINLYDPLRTCFYDINYPLYKSLGLEDCIESINKKFQECEQKKLYEISICLPEFIISLHNDSKVVLQKFYAHYWDNNKIILTNNYNEQIMEIESAKQSYLNQEDQFNTFLQIPNIKATIDEIIKNQAINIYNGLINYWNEFISQNYTDQFKNHADQVVEYFHTNDIEKMKVRETLFELVATIEQLINSVMGIKESITQAQKV
ncbi:24951_t:CDS:1, partial [Gigaspora margarita]